MSTYQQPSTMFKVDKSPSCVVVSPIFFENIEKIRQAKSRFRQAKNIFCDKIKTLGFKHAFKAGISFGKDDLLIPKTKESLINNTKKQIEEYEKQYSDVLITRGEKYNKVVDI